MSQGWRDIGRSFVSTYTMHDQIAPKKRIELMNVVYNLPSYLKCYQACARRHASHTASSPMRQVTP